MSRIACIAGFTILAGVTAGSESSAQDLRAMGARLERQVGESQRASAALKEYDSPSRAYATAVDTFLIGGGAIVVLGKQSISSVVRDAAARADSNLRRVPSALAGVRGSLVFVDVDTMRRYRAFGDRSALIRYGTPPLNNAAVAEGRVDADEIARFIEGTTVNRALDRSRSAFSRWRRGDLRIRRADVDQPIDWGAVRLDILWSRSLLGPRCYRGEIPACSMLLGLTTVDDPVMAWYDSLARVEEVKARRGVTLTYDRADTEACLAGNDAACGRALHTIKVFVQPPAGGLARDALTLEALRLGGDGAAERMLASRGTAAEALAAGAGVPVDSILRAWQRHLHDESIASETLSWRMVIMTMGWVLLLFGLSTRISRWR